MPAGYDAEVADLFRDLRAASGMSETDLAAQLATRLEVVQALEQGAIYALPPWPETCRVVSTYGTLLNLDVRPLLRRIYAQIDAGIVELAPKPMPDVPVMMPPQDGMSDQHMRPAQGDQRTADSFPAAPRQQPQPPRPQQAMPNRRPLQGGQPQTVQFRPPPQGQPQTMPPRGAPQRQPQPQPQAYAQPQGLRVQAPQRGETLVLTHQQARPQPAAPQPAPPQQAAPQAKAAKKAPAPAAAPKKKARGGLLKWGVALLLASAIAFGLWVWLAQPSLFGLLGSGATPSEETAPVTNDPTDPRSRKGDRLPSPASQ